MAAAILAKVDNQLKKYQAEHRGEAPLYIMVSPDEADQLISEVKVAQGYASDLLVTSYKGSKILKHESLQKGDLLLSNELPDTGS